MHEINSFVFFDIETTGLPCQERNKTKITELSFVVASRQDIMLTSYGELPTVSKLSLVFNPMKSIHPEAVKMTGLSNDKLKNAPLFKQKIKTILSFLQELTRPICLVAHNGNKFDYKILLTEFNDANASLPSDLLCVDSLVGFRYILKDRNIHIITQPMHVHAQKKEPDHEVMTDDEDDWPDLNVTTEDWQDIDNICESLSDVSCEDIAEVPNKVFKKKGNNAIRNVFNKQKRCNSNGYSLVTLYKQFFAKEAINSHRAEGDCLMLLQCVVATKEVFVPWADSACKKVKEMKPLIRY
ncbi:unnamed protein product [Diatraea saccharalis]|uniref:Exonuclease domain-containing protein n=1 Tax=Diatraea saccharalis TaxID=40085 RepID=A0A9N9WFU4_9NEOP|nr:unnamed protein product [Diatraea saccharalis]